MLIDWVCYRVVMAWPLPLPDCRDNRVFAWCLARAGRYAHPVRAEKKEPPSVDALLVNVRASSAMLAKTVEEWDAKFGDAPTPPNAEVKGGGDEQ
jgi:hypothetical protein